MVVFKLQGVLRMMWKGKDWISCVENSRSFNSYSICVNLLFCPNSASSIVSR
jgi:hypothetical protein